MPKTIDKKPGETRISMTNIKNGEIFTIPQGYRMNYALVETVTTTIEEEVSIALGKYPNPTEILPTTVLPPQSRRKNLSNISRKIFSASGDYACRVNISSPNTVINLYVSVIKGI